MAASSSSHPFYSLDPITADVVLQQRADRSEERRRALLSEAIGTDVNVPGALDYWDDQLRDAIAVSEHRGGQRPPGLEGVPYMRVRNATNARVRSRTRYLDEWQAYEESRFVSDRTPSWLLEAKLASSVGRPPFEYLTHIDDPHLASFAPKTKYKYRGGVIYPVTQRIRSLRPLRLRGRVPQPNYDTLQSPEYWDENALQYWLAAQDFPDSEALRESGGVTRPDWDGPQEGVPDSAVGTQFFIFRFPIALRGESDDYGPQDGATLRLYHKRTRMLVDGRIAFVSTHNRRVGYVRLDACVVQTAASVDDVSAWELITRYRSKKRSRADPTRTLQLAPPSDVF